MTPGGRSSRMPSGGARRYYPISLDLRERACVVVGGGAVAEQKVLGLLEAGARVLVVSPVLSWRLEDLAAQGVIEVRRRRYRGGDLEGAFVAIAATDDRAVNRAAWAEAEERGTLLNAVDDPDRCHFIAPAVHRQGDLTVAVSTAGKSPALAVRLRDRIGRVIGPEHATLVDLLGEWREEVARRVPQPRRRAKLWYEIVDSDVLDWIRRGDVPRAGRRIAELVRTAEEPEAPRPAPGDAQSGGKVYLVGAGPGSPGLITVRGLELVQAADVVAYDRLVHPKLLDLAPPWAERIFVGKRPTGRSVEQRRINQLLIDLARAGRVVVRLKGGDPFVFGRGGEECEALRRAGVQFEVVPGVTAAIAAPASAGIPVTHRRYASAFAVVAGHECDGEPDLDWAALARLPALVVLMGLRALPEIASRLLAHGAHPETPAAVIANGTLDNERTVIGPLVTIAALVSEAGLEPPATLVVGEIVRVRDLLAAPDALVAASAGGRTP